jgi:hypothetical protein
MKKIITSLLVAGLSFASTSVSEAADVSQYVQFITPITTQTIELPKSGNSKDIEFLVTAMNPNKDVSTVDFQLYDASGDKIDSEWMYFFDEPSKTEKKTFNIYSWGFTPVKLPLTLKVIVKFHDSAAKFNLEQTYTLNVIPNQAEIIEKAAQEAKAKAEKEAQAKLQAEQQAKYNAEMASAKLKIVESFNSMYVGKSCSKVGSTKTVMNLVKYTCIKSGKKLVWNKGILIG